ncbi:hypothetical protein QCA50_008127 [Cerrena zonata]|uniref:Cellulase n=1 Tax=Cerrena zonata TaxID=2478898 RepID=A0AAW0GAB0_9APHY
MWGLTAIYAYRAYQDRTFLDDAQAIWEQILAWRISEEDAEKGTHPLRNGTFSSSCAGASVAGDVFYHIDDVNDLAIVASSEG